MKNETRILKVKRRGPCQDPKRPGLTKDTVKEVARQVKLSVDAGIQVGIVIGGGNFWRAVPVRPLTGQRRTRLVCWPLL